MFNKKGFGINFGGSSNKGSGKHKPDDLPPKKTVEYTGEASYENDRNEEIEELREQFQLQAKREVEARDDYMDNEFYSCIVFSNKAQRQAFFKQLGVDCGDETDVRFINGVKLAEILGFELPPMSKLPPERFKQSKDVLKLAHLPKPTQRKK